MTELLQKNTDDFLQKYKQLEQLVLSKFFVKEGESALWALGSIPEFVALRPHLNAIREIRNFLAHQPKYGDQPLIMPTDAAVKIVDSLAAKLQGPNIVYGICIKLSGVLCAKLDDQVAPIVKLMREREYDIVPILCGGRVIGVFSDSSNIAHEIDSETTFFNLKHDIDLQRHIGRTVLFISKTATIEAAKLMVAESFKQGFRIDAIFVTETGKPEESLLGLLLPLQLV